MKGYNSQYQLEEKWLREIPYFLKLREIDLYAVIHRSFNETEYDNWCRAFMAGRREKIENNQPFADFDFSY